MSELFWHFFNHFEAPKCPECVDEYDDIKLDVLLFGFSPFSRLSMRTVMGRWYCVLDRSMTAAASWFDSTAVHTLGSMTVCLFVCWSLHPFAFAALFFLLHIKY